MSRLSVREFRPGDLHSASALLAGAHARRQLAGVRLGERYFERSGCTLLLEQLLSSPRATAVVCERGGRVQGYLAGERQLYAPEDFASIYAEPRSTNVPLHGHAVADGEDAAAVYEALYAELAREWIADGFFIHNVAVSAQEAAVLEAWSLLGFGRKSVCAIRPTSPLASDGERRAEVRIEEIRGRDDEVLELFHRRLMTFQTGAPMFWPYTGESDAKVRAVRRDAMASGQGFAYVARGRKGKPLGSLLFVPSVFLSPLLVCDDMMYLWEGFVEEDQRAAGVGSMLLDHALERLRERGIAWCALHFVSGNPRGGRFWPSKGFVPIEVVMNRHVDERVAWARGLAE